MSGNKICLALGFFDSVHLGHRKILSSLLSASEKYEAKACAMTFSNNIYGLVKRGEKLIYTYEERLSIFEKLGIKVIPFEFTARFKALDKRSFLNIFLDSYDVKAFICGKDFTFGLAGTGNADFLKKFSSSVGIDCIVENDVCFEDKKISTTSIKELLVNGKNLDKVNYMLGDNYFVSGQVVHGMGRGRSLGFPTANVAIPMEKYLLGQGVYSTSTIIDDKEYKSITNVGPKPTFAENNVLIETHLLDFSQDIYGKKIKLIFNRFMRDIICFSNSTDLMNQLMEDRKIRCSE